MTNQHHEGQGDGRLCVICQERHVERPDVCEPCRRRIARQLGEVDDYCAELAQPTQLEAEHWPRRYALKGADLGVAQAIPVYDPDAPGEVHRDTKGKPLHRDPIAATLPAGPVRGANTDSRISGSREPAAPLNLDGLDLLGHPVKDPRTHQVAASTRDTLIPWVRTTRRTVLVEVIAHGEPEWRAVTTWTREAVRDDAGRPMLIPAQDQTGVQPVAVILDQWVRNWIDHRPQHHEHVPQPEVGALIGWLGNRLQWACDHHPAIDDFATELDELRGQLRRALGLTEPRPELHDGVPCKSCDKMTLQTQPGDDYVECDTCGRLYTGAEFADWVKLTAHSPKTKAIQAGLAEIDAA